MRKDALKWASVAVFIALSMLALVKVVYQDVPRIKLEVTHNDMQPLYLSSRVWLSGGNPYDPATLREEMKRSIPEELQVLNGDCGLYCQVFYPPTAIPVFAPASLLPWKAYFALCLFLIVSVYLFCLYTLAQMLESTNLKLLFWGIGLVFSPFHSGIGSVNVSVLLIPVIFLCVLRKQTTAAAIGMGVVACIKPPLALLFIGYYVLSGQKKKAFASIATIVLVASISLLRLRGTGWLSSYKLALSFFSVTTDGPGGVATHGVANIGFLNLQAIFYLFLHNAKAAVTLDNLVLVCLYAAVIFPLFRRSGKIYASENHLAIMAAVCGLTLFLPSLQYYNGLLLLAPALYSLRLRPDAARIFIGIACATFALPPRWFTIFDIFKKHAVGTRIECCERKRTGSESATLFRTAARSGSAQPAGGCHLRCPGGRPPALARQFRQDRLKCPPDQRPRPRRICCSPTTYCHLSLFSCLSFPKGICVFGLNILGRDALAS